MAEKGGFRRDEEGYSDEVEVPDEWVNTDQEIEVPRPPIVRFDTRDALALWADKFQGIPIDFWRELGVQSEGNKYIAFTWPEGWKKIRDITLRVDVKTSKNRHIPRFWWSSPPPGGVHPLWPTPDAGKHEEIWITEGESDCAVLRFLGFDAYTFGSATNIPGDIELRMLDAMGVKRAVLIFDADKPGREATVAISSVLAEGNNIDIIPIDLGKLLKSWRYVKDVRDLFNNLPLEDVRSLLMGARASVLDDREEDISAKVIAQRAVDPEWVWEGLIAKNALNLVFGEPKAGKTTLTFHFVKAASGEEPQKLLERTVKPQRILYYSEMPESFDKEVMYRVCDGPPTNLWLRNSSHHVFEGMTWPAIVGQIERDVRKYKITYVIIDTVIEWFKFSSEEMYDAAVVGEKLRLLRRLTSKGVTVQINHHPPKAGGSPFGSIAFQGYVDCLVEMERDENGTTLSAKGRLRSDFSSLRYAYADSEGKELAVLNIDDKADRGIDAKANASVKKRILAALPYAPGSITLDELRERDEAFIIAGKQFPTRMLEMVKAGLVEETSDRPKRYRRTLGFKVEVQGE